ncbi:Multi antimicrobial extrusion protein [Dillenia turbinata]|uniref:Protein DETOXIFICATION n=1 Tax=Dillenia turbinata TaxID=194707 RepID=A0AAN8ZRV0_9MAGN
MAESLNEKLLSNVGVKEEAVVCEEKPVDKIWIETKKLWVVAGPAIFTRFSMFGLNVISQAFVGHIGAKELAAYALVVTVILRFANGILVGMASALETLCGQAYGAKQHHMLGVYLQRSWIVLFICSIFLLPFFVFTTPLLKALGQDREIAEISGTVSLWFIPIMFSYIISFTTQMFLQSQSKNRVIGFLAAFSLSIHIFFSWLLTVKYKFRLAGAMTSTILAYWIPNAGQLMYITCGWCSETWKGFSPLAFKDLWPVIKLSVIEVWYNTVLILLTGNMKNSEVAIDALSICININGWEMMISLGFMAAAGVRVSNELGRGSSKAAKFSIVTAALTSFAIGFALFLFFLFIRGHVAYVFTEKEEVAMAVAGLSPLLACSILLNSVQPVLTGVSVGAGWQTIVVYVNVACYYLLGIPIGAVLGYVINLQVKGVWIGMLLGTFVQTVALMVITYRTDWDEQVLLARKRVKKWSVPESEDSNS